ncbi:MAG: methylated-DNA--[protein]-cysteine S-methyltransferase, partial [Flavobacteriales bacterium]|nr:methylated-DNA--[protein]-cysteine S-methyltransferase [Flavobacteriales bacterium]
MIKIQYFKTAFGELILGSYENKLCLCDWRFRKMRDSIDKRIKNNLKSEFIEESSEVIETCKIQLEEYFNKERKIFDLPILMVGTEFQKQVWNALIEVPYSKTSSYLDLSKKIKNPDAVRAVATANGANAIAIIIPCHRIIGSNGSLVGYAGG